MLLGDIIYEPGEQLQHAYFPTTSIVSLHYVTESGASAETAGVGNEGMVGIALFMGGDTTPSSAVVKTAGHAYRLERRLLKEEFARAGLLHRVLLRYTQALITQMTQTAACNRHHSVEQQLCRWLLTTLDRVPSHELTMTQELVASMLGVRREGITEAAGKLQQSGLHPLPARTHRSARPVGSRDTRVRVLCRRQEGIGATAVGRAAPPGCPRRRIVPRRHQSGVLRASIAGRKKTGAYDSPGRNTRSLKLLAKETG